MIKKGKSRADPVALYLQLGNAETNERIQLLETAGTVADDLRGALIEMAGFGLGTRCQRPLYHAAISPQPPHRLTPAQRLQAIDALEEKMGLVGRARVVVLHEKEGREHLHVVWSRIDLRRMATVSDSHNYRKHEEVARYLERRFGHSFVQGAHADRSGKPRPQRTPSRAELRLEERSGVRIYGVVDDVTAAFRSSGDAEAFRLALRGKGYILARGDRRDFVVIDAKRGVHNLERRIEGLRTTALRSFMASLDLSSLPTVDEATAKAAAPRRNPSRAPSIEFRASWRRLAAHRAPHPRARRRARSVELRAYAFSLTTRRALVWRIPFRLVGGSILRPIPVKMPRLPRPRRVAEMKAAWRYFLPRRRPSSPRTRMCRCEPGRAD
jgi:hypothetical protein